MLRPVVAVLALCACKAQLGGDPVDGGNSDVGGTIDASPDAEIPLGPWSTPTLIPGADSTASEDDCTLSSTKTELIFKRADADNNLYVMTRASVASAWSAPVELTILNTTAAEESPRLSPDDLTLYFGRAGDIYRSTRTAVGQPWGAPVAVAAVNTAAYEKWLAVCDNGYAIVSRDNGTNGQDFYEGTVSGGTNTLVAQLNSTTAEQGTMLTTDCLRVYFQSNRSGQFDIYTASRLSTTSAWTNATALTDFNTTAFVEEDPWISTDQRVFVFSSDAAGNKDLYISTR